MKNQSQLGPIIGNICLQKIIIFLTNQWNPHNQRKSCIRDTRREERGDLIVPRRSRNLDWDLEWGVQGGWGLNLKERPGRQEVKGNSRRDAAPERTMVSCLEDFKHVTWERRVSTVAESETYPSQRDYSVQILGSEVVLKSYTQTCSKGSVLSFSSALPWLTHCLVVGPSSSWPKVMMEPRENQRGPVPSS